MTTSPRAKRASPAKSDPKPATTKLSAILDEDGLIDEATEKRSVTWNKKTFDVIIKKEMSAADYEFIYFQMNGTETDKSILARRVHRMIRQEDGKPIPLNVTSIMKTSLLQAICNQINEVEIVPQKVDEGKG